MNYRLSLEKSPNASHAKTGQTEHMEQKKEDLSVDIYEPISSFVVGKSYKQVFLIDKVLSGGKMISSNGVPFIKISLKDITGEISGVIWGAVENLCDGTYAKLLIDVKIYKEEMIFHAEAENVKILDEIPLNINDYTEGLSELAVANYSKEIENEILAMDDRHYRDLLCNAIYGRDLMLALSKSPYSLSNAMCYPGGLLMHIVHSIRLAKVACKQATELEMKFSPSLVISGCILRNVGWIMTTKFQGNKIKTKDVYKLGGIYAASAKYIDRLVLKCENDLNITIPENKIQALENICNVRENIHTLEGEIVSCADNMADVLDFGNASLQRKRTGNWIEEHFVGHL